MPRPAVAERARHVEEGLLDLPELDDRSFQFVYRELRDAALETSIISRASSASGVSSSPRASRPLSARRAGDDDERDDEDEDEDERDRR